MANDPDQIPPITSTTKNTSTNAVARFSFLQNKQSRQIRQRSKGYHEGQAWVNSGFADKCYCNHWGHRTYRLYLSHISGLNIAPPAR